MTLVEDVRAVCARLAPQGWGELLDHACASTYVGWIHERFEYDVAELRGLYARLPNPPSWVRAPGTPPAVPSPRAASAGPLPGFSPMSSKTVAGRKQASNLESEASC
jgi:hypothetical protein